MATLHPFRALRPRPELAAKVASVPYDVVSSSEARILADGNDLSFLHVIRPEIDLPVGIDEHDDAVYKKGAENLRRFASSDYFVTEAEPALYAYRLIMNGRPQTGLFGCVSVEDYDRDVILKHEKTRPAKEDDRTRHIIEQSAHAEPVMLTYRDNKAVEAIVAKAVRGQPLYDFLADDGVQHTVWRIPESEALANLFKEIPTLYVADGHHRCKAASRAANEFRRKPGSLPHEGDYFPAVLFPMGNMQIMPYNRIVKRLGSSATDFLGRLRQVSQFAESESAEPAGKGQICVYLDSKWYSVNLPETGRTGTAASLDVARLGEHLLEPLLSISDPRTDPNLDFVGGIRGTKALERMVDSGEAEMAISMYPTSVEELVAVSDAGELMPPKSTWFEPKLRSGLLVHLIGTDQTDD